MIALAVVAAAAAAALLFPARPHPIPAADSARGERRPVPLGLVMGVGLAVMVLVVVPRPASLVIAPIVALVGGRIVDRMEPLSVRRRRQRLQAQLPQVVDLLSASLQSGSAPTSALELVAGIVQEPMRSELGNEVAQLRLGADPVRVWRALAVHEQLGPLGRALQRASDTGAPVGESLARLADEIRAARRAQVMVRARSVETKATAPLGACLLPAFVLIGVVPLVAEQFGSLAFL